MAQFVTALDTEGLDRVAEQTHPLWGGGRDLAAHRTRIDAQITRSAGSMRYVALIDGGAIACSLKRHQVALDTPQGRIDAIGIGAVFTPRSLRKRGVATALLRAVLDEARDDGCQAALLFSDIDTAFYERLGFTVTSAATWSCRPSALPTEGALERHPSDDLDLLCALRDASYRGPWLRAHRSPTSWRFGAWLNHTGPAELLGPPAAPRGYVVTRRTDEGVLWVDDAIADEPETLWASLRAVAVERGASTIAGWLRADLAGGPFVARRRRRCIPMVSALDDALRGLSSWRGHFSSLDHF